MRISLISTAFAVLVLAAGCGDDSGYRVATNSFLAAGGDGYPAFKGFLNRKDGTQWLRALMLKELQTRGAIRLVAEQRIRSVE